VTFPWRRVVVSRDVIQSSLPDGYGSTTSNAVPSRFRIDSFLDAL